MTGNMLTANTTTCHHVSSLRRLSGNNSLPFRQTQTFIAFYEAARQAWQRRISEGIECHSEILVADDSTASVSALLRFIIKFSKATGASLTGLHLSPNCKQFSLFYTLLHSILNQSFCLDDRKNPITGRNQVMRLGANGINPIKSMEDEHRVTQASHFLSGLV